MIGCRLSVPTLSATKYFTAGILFQSKGIRIIDIIFQLRHAIATPFILIYFWATVFPMHVQLGTNAWFDWFFN